jgi:hemerythrin-like domain-containing protein
VARLASIVRNPFAFLFTRSSAEEQVVAYLIREHRRGRRLTEILQDRYVQNRLTPHQQARLLDRPEVVHALGEQDVDLARESLARR